MALEDAPGEEVDEGLEEVREEDLVSRKTLAALPATRSPGLPTNTVMCQERMTPLSSSAAREVPRPGRRAWG